MTTSEKRIGKFESRLRHWGTKLDELVAKADEVDAEVKTDYQHRLDEFRAKHHAAQVKLGECTAAGSERWDQFKVGIESSWSELESAFRELTHPSKRHS